MKFNCAWAQGPGWSWIRKERWGFLCGVGVSVSVSEWAKDEMGGGVEGWKRWGGMGWNGMERVSERTMGWDGEKGRRRNGMKQARNREREQEQERRTASQ